MPLLRIIGSKRVWIALFASIIAVIALCALGAWAIVRGFLQPDSSAAWLCGSFALAGLLAGWIAGGKGDGILLRAALLGLLMAIVIWLISLTISNGTNYLANGWKMILAYCAGCLLTETIVGRKNGKRIHGKSKKRTVHLQRKVGRR